MFIQILFKRVEIFCLLKGVRGFAPYGWANLRQRHLTCVGFAEGAFIFKKFRLVWILFSGAVWRTSLRQLGHWLLTYLKAIELKHWLNLSVTDNQFRVSNFLWDICAILSNCRQERMHLFWQVSIFYLSWGTKQNKRSRNVVELEHYTTIVSGLELKICFSDREILAYYWFCL